MAHAMHPIVRLLFLGSGHDLLGYAASSLVLVTFCMTSMWRLRVTALLSNVAFIGYATVDDLRPVLVLHCILLPVNAFRLAQLLVARKPAARDSRDYAGAAAVAD